MKTEIDDWIVRATLAGMSEAEIVAGVCERLSAAGIRLERCAVAANLLDPIWDARIVRWIRGQGSKEETFARSYYSDNNEDWIRSPFFHLLESRQPRLRRRLDATYPRGEFPMLDELRDQGATDYVAFVERVGKGVVFAESEGMAASWTTDAADGFPDTHVETLAGIMPALTLAFMLFTANRTARTTIATYLGSDAAERVLAGNIVRGRASSIRAIVWYSDLTGFTRIADTATPETVLELLNDYAEAQVEAIERHDGHVLKFIGDGMLAIFPGDDTTRACLRALEAASDLRRRIVKLNERRRAAGLPVTDAHLALHVGDVLYGNLGSPRRLDFTVLGAAVNEAARLEALCGSLEQGIIVSSAFAEVAGEARNSLVSLGRYAMKGVARPQELFTLDPNEAGS